MARFTTWESLRNSPPQPEGTYSLYASMREYGEFTNLTWTIARWEAHSKTTRLHRNKSIAKVQISRYYPERIEILQEVVDALNRGAIEERDVLPIDWGKLSSFCL